MSEIEIRNLTKTFDIKGRTVHALKNISLSIGQGDIFGIIGMSGAGKSTLVRSINYLEKPTEGQVLIDGVDLADLTEKQLRKKRSDIGMIFQNFNLLEQKNVLDNICFPLEIAVLDESGAVVDVDVRPRLYSPGSEATSPIFSRLSTKSAISAAD